MKISRLFVCLLCLVMTLALTAACFAEAEAPDGAALSQGAQIRVMSYNILHPDWSRVPVDGRDEIVAEILLFYRPDVVALQEAGAKWHKALKPLLVDTGYYAPACRQSNADGFTYCTTCFLYNPRTVSLVEEYILDLEYKHATRVFAVAVFERLSDGARFAVANTHPAPTEEPKKYEKNMAAITTLTADTLVKYADLPVIVAGDFNTPEQSEMYLRYMEEAGVLDAKYEAAVLERSCSTYFGYQVAPDTDDTECCIDHLFVNGKVDVKLYDAVVGHDVQNASDHIPIYADIALY